MYTNIDTDKDTDTNSVPDTDAGTNMDTDTDMDQNKENLKRTLHKNMNIKTGTAMKSIHVYVH
jgi:hypothetical protein